MGGPPFKADARIPLPWTTPDKLPRLDEGQVHLWRFGLEPSMSVETRLEATLNDEERHRADRFRGQGLRKKFIAGRGMLRSLLGAYVGRSPVDLGFSYGIHGKPELADGSLGISFNLAHSGEIALCAIAQGGPVGVDVETQRPLENAEKIVRRFFSLQEQAAFDALPQAEKFAAFYLGWTRKEAFLKATGTGLATRLDSFDVNLTPGEPARILRIDESLNGPGDWKIHDVDPGAGYAGALVVSCSIGTKGSSGPLVQLWDATTPTFFGWS